MAAEFRVDRVDGERFAQGKLMKKMAFHQIEIMGLVCFINEGTIKRKSFANQIERFVDNGSVYLFFNKHFCHCPDE